MIGMESMDAHLVEQALNYHGEPLQKVWEEKRDKHELEMLNLKEPSFEIYQQRQKTLSFADSGKRLKLQQFIAKKADVLYDKSNLEITKKAINQQLGDGAMYASIPGIDSFVTVEKSQRVRNLLESLITGDVIYAQVMGKSSAGLLLKILCDCSDFPRVVPSLGIKALILNSATIPAVEKKGVTRGYMVNDLVCVCVSEVNVEAERVIAVMNKPPREGLAPHPPLGLITSDDLPEAYKKIMDNKGATFESLLESSTGFSNPGNIKYLCDLMLLGQDNYSNMIGLREKFPLNEYAAKLRKLQASKWALRSVEAGIDHFKAGRHSEAFQCLNKALVIDPVNEEGLVSRGCLYATSGSLKKAIVDFEMVLKLNQSHTGARKYLAETLVALGRSYEEEKNFEEAQETYEKCLVLVPNHEAAQNALEFLGLRTLGESNENSREAMNLVEVNDKPVEVKEDKRKRRMNRKSSSKKKQRWSSSSSSSSDSSSSSSSSSSSNSRSTSRSPTRKKHSRDRASLSPLSKRMAMYNNPQEASNELPEMMFPTASESRNEIDDYELKVRQFLDQTKDDSDYEDKVRIFFAAASKWKKEKEKEKKYCEGEKSKKRRKKDKKAKDREEKKSRKKKKREDRRKYKASREKADRSMEILDQSSLPDLHHLESKLNAYHSKVRKPIADIFDEESKYMYPEHKVSSPNASAMSAKIKAQAARQKDLISQSWQEFSVDPENDLEKKLRTSALDKSLSVHKQIQREYLDKRVAAQPPRKPSISPPMPKESLLKEIPIPREPSEKCLPPLPKNNFHPSVTLHDKLIKLSNSNNQPPEPPSRPRSPSRSPPRAGSDSDEGRRAFARKRELNGRYIPRRNSGERPPRRSGIRSRNISSSDSSRSRSPKRSRSRSLSGQSRKSGSFERKYSRSRSRSYSRSGSRSRSRSSSRSRSRSGDRRYRSRQTRPYNNRGGYYNPRFQGHNPNFRGGQNFQNGNRFYNNNPNQRYNNGNRRGFQPRYNNYHSPNYRGRGGPRGGRFFHNNRQGGFRDFRDNRRDFRERRSYSRERYSDRSLSPDPMRRVDEAKKKINKIIESGDDVPKVESSGTHHAEQRHEGPLSEGEEREYDDYKRWTAEEKPEIKAE